MLDFWLSCLSRAKACVVGLELMLRMPTAASIRRLLARARCRWRNSSRGCASSRPQGWTTKRPSVGTGPRGHGSLVGHGRRHPFSTSHLEEPEPGYQLPRGAEQFLSVTDRFDGLVRGGGFSWIARVVELVVAWRHRVSTAPAIRDVPWCRRIPASPLTPLPRGADQRRSESVAALSAAETKVLGGVLAGGNDGVSGGQR